MNPDEIISKYKMDKNEAFAYKLSLLWYKLSRKVLPDYNHTRYHENGDPRKSQAFKFCYKLYRERMGIIPDDEYSLYIRAQLDVLKHLMKNNYSVLVDPSCLVGDKAWVRWKMWKAKYDKIVNKPLEVSRITHPGVAKAIDGLVKTKEFLTKNIGSDPTIEKYEEIKLNNNFYRWVNLGKISPYYLIISPFIKKVFSEEELKKISFDLTIYNECITEEVLDKFTELFENEKEG